MIFNYLTLGIALLISSVAIFYSVAGLASIFAASFVAVVIMGTVLEVGKLITAVWLHRNWKEAVWWLKTYLSVAVLILMFITSMGIFGFLSKSHIEQTTASDEQIAKIQVLDETIIRLKTKINNWDKEILRLSTGNVDTRVDNLVVREEVSLDKINNNVNKEKDRYRTQANTDVAVLNNKILQAQSSLDKEISSINEQLKTCFNCADERQALNDAKANFSSKEAQYNNEITIIRTELKANLSIVDSKYQPQINTINNRINSLKNQSTDKTEDIDSRLLVIEQNIENTQIKLTANVENKAVLETNFRKLEAEVGPIKYIAEFVYGGSADRGILEQAVSWIIVIIIFVFDPLAVLLLIASQYSFEQSRKNPVKTSAPTELTTDEYVRLIGKTYSGKYNPLDSDIQEPKVVEKVQVKKKPKVPKVAKSDVITDDQVDIITEMILATGPNAYINFNGKTYRKSALQIEHPELITDVKSTVEFGTEFPENQSNSTLFISTDQLPTKLYRFNGESWVQLDKNVLAESAYSREYIKHLIEKINDHDYDPVLLEAILSEGTNDRSEEIFNEKELKHINEFRA
jgi:phage host-nuclease inhibitor protein Gam